LPSLPDDTNPEIESKPKKEGAEEEKLGDQDQTRPNVGAIKLEK
jgi:hypothetical protein